MGVVGAPVSMEIQLCNCYSYHGRLMIVGIGREIVYEDLFCLVVLCPRTLETKISSVHSYLKLDLETVRENW